MGNKNYNNYYNRNEHENIQHSHEIPVVETSINKVEEIENKEIEETIVESTDPSAVETTPISGINETIIEDETTGEETVIITEKSEEQVQNENITQISAETNVQNIRVIANALNIRRIPNKDGDVVNIVYKNELLVLLESTSVDGFYHVRTAAGFEGYCMEQFVELV